MQPSKPRAGDAGKGFAVVASEAEITRNVAETSTAANEMTTRATEVSAEAGEARQFSA
jgi:hypothetical protein